jgi:uncharacterized protein YjbI with pentapeptide repeats
VTQSPIYRPITEGVLQNLTTVVIRDVEYLDLRNLTAADPDEGCSKDESDLLYAVIQKSEMLVDLSGSKLKKADFQTLDLNDAMLMNVNLMKANLGYADMQRVHLEGSILVRADCTALDLTDAHLHQANLYQAILREAILVRADLVEADLRRTKMQDAELEGAILRGADMEQANLEYATWGLNRPLSFKQVSQVKGLPQELVDLANRNLRFDPNIWGDR